MQRFYINDLNTTNFTFILSDVQMIHQLTKVLRVKVWEKVVFFDGNDNYDYIFQVKKIDKKDIILEQVWREENNSEISFELNLYQSMPNKQEKIEYIIQKWVEVWIKNFVFFRSERSQKLIISDNRLDRFTKIAIEAIEQSGRNYVPEIVFLDKLEFSLLKNDENIFFHTESEDSSLLKNIELNYNKNINLFVWPEGWFSEDEIRKMDILWFKKSHLWDRILRTETTWMVTSFYIIQNR